MSSEFITLLKKHLITNKLISPTDKIHILPTHIKTNKGITECHYVILIEHKSIKFFLRTVKEKDYSYIMVDYLSELNNKRVTPCFPQAILPPFTLGEKRYILTTYIDGTDLEQIIDQCSDTQLVNLANKLDSELHYLHSTTNNEYSDGYKFSNRSWAEITLSKIINKLYNEPMLNEFKTGINLFKLETNIKHILSNSDYSSPTLIHLDIKPANIIVSNNLESLYLIDFELARFGDIDYEWTNLLVKTLMHYDNRFKKYVLNEIIHNNFVDINTALKNKKYSVYMLYHAINNYIYYQLHGINCPMEIKDLLVWLLRKLERG